MAEVAVVEAFLVSFLLIEKLVYENLEELMPRQATAGIDE